jgi:hypothetical protein
MSIIKSEYTHEGALMAQPRTDANRIQFNLPAEQVKVLDMLTHKLALRSRADLIPAVRRK